MSSVIFLRFLISSIESSLFLFLFPRDGSPAMDLLSEGQLS